MFGAPADLLSLLYLAMALYTAWQLPGRWRALIDDTYTDEDRNLAGRIGFLLLTPIGVLIHELSHMAAATLLGGRDISLSYRVYWGYVTYRGQIGPTADSIVASAGPGTSRSDSGGPGATSGSRSPTPRCCSTSCSTPP